MSQWGSWKTVYNESAYNGLVKYALSLALFLLPALSIAATIEAGFPSHTIWVSPSSAVEGDTVVISTVVYNSGTKALRGTLAFTANGARIGTREFEIPSGESQIHSVEWKPKKGRYDLAARLEGTSAELSQRETPPITVIIAEPPPPSALEQTISQTVETAATVASSSAPVIMNIAQTIFAETETFRHAGIERLEQYLAASATHISPATSSNVQGFAAGTSTNAKSGASGSGASNIKNALSTVTQTAAAAALFTMKNAVLFYPLLILLALGSLYALARGIRRPNNY